MKKFLLTQKFDASAEAVAAAFRDEATWQAFADLPFVGTPNIARYEAGERTKIAMAYRVDIDLPALAESFIDAKKMTFVEETELHEDGSGTFVIIPDHYGKLLSSKGRIEMVPFDDHHCERLIQGSVDVSLGWTGKLFEGPVEDAIVNGLKQALAAQADQVQFS